MSSVSEGGNASAIVRADIVNGAAVAALVSAVVVSAVVMVVVMVEEGGEGEQLPP